MTAHYSQAYLSIYIHRHTYTGHYNIHIGAQYDKLLQLLMRTTYSFVISLHRGGSAMRGVGMGEREWILMYATVDGIRNGITAAEFFRPPKLD